MKKYERTAVNSEDTLAILSKIGEVLEFVGWTARVKISINATGTVSRTIEIPTASWFELKEAE